MCDVIAKNKPSSGNTISFTLQRILKKRKRYQAGKERNTIFKINGIIGTLEAYKSGDTPLLISDQYIALIA